jgi:hypothetical protein
LISGGGYIDFIEAMRDPKHPQHDELSEWYDGPFDAEAFNIDDVNCRLARLS